MSDYKYTGSVLRTDENGGVVEYDGRSVKDLETALAEETDRYIALKSAVQFVLGVDPIEFDDPNGPYQYGCCQKASGKTHAWHCWRTILQSALNPSKEKS